MLAPAIAANVDGEQNTQVDEAAPEYDPLSHTLQVFGSVAPTVVEKLPASHSVQFASVSLYRYDPAAHGVHPEAPSSE